jgi:phenylalanyl-tRNA synthetase beta chain
LGWFVTVLRNTRAGRAGRVRVFEIGRVFRRDPRVEEGDDRVAGITQPVRLAALAYGLVEPLQWSEPDRAVDFFDAKGDLEALLSPRKAAFVPGSHPALHPGRGARIEVDGRCVGHVGELHPRWRHAYELPAAPVLFELDLDALVQRDVPVFHPISRQQAAWRDLAFVLRQDIQHDAVIAAIEDEPSGLVRSATLFDIYKPPRPTTEIGSGEHSMAVRIELLDEQATLTDERIEGAIGGVVARLQAAFGAKLRG